MRPSRLDELPQLWNVLRGDMSLVGPRPNTLPATKTLEREISGFSERFKVRPGLTGLSQVRRNSLRQKSTEEVGILRRRVRLDLFYIRKRSLCLDIKILLRTPWAVLRHMIGTPT